jgi:hypothetical protein
MVAPEGFIEDSRVLSVVQQINCMVQVGFFNMFMQMVVFLFFFFKVFVFCIDISLGLIRG